MAREGVEEESGCALLRARDDKSGCAAKLGGLQVDGVLGPRTVAGEEGAVAGLLTLLGGVKGQSISDSFGEIANATGGAHRAVLSHLAPSGEPRVHMGELGVQVCSLGRLLPHPVKRWRPDPEPHWVISTVSTDCAVRRNAAAEPTQRAAARQLQRLSQRHRLYGRATVLLMRPKHFHRSTFECNRRTEET